MTKSSRILLLGMMGSGKTTVGMELQALTGWPYLDNDRLLRAGTGRGPDELAVELGPEGLHELEMEQLASAVEREGPAVLGGAASVIENPRIRKVLDACFVVYLRAAPETLALRVGAGAGRPWVASETLAVLQRLLEPRAALYEAAANYIIDVDSREPREIAQSIWVAYQQDMHATTKESR